MNRVFLSILPLAGVLCGCWQKPQATTDDGSAGESGPAPQISAQTPAMSRADIAGDVTSLQAELDRVSTALAQQERLAETYRQHYWTSLPGKFIGSIEVDGRMYENARIERVTPTEITIRHRIGMGTFPASAFPLYFRKQLLLSPPDDVTTPVR